jgi:hypothetical protein
MNQLIRHAVLTIFCASCTGLTFNPDAWRANHHLQALISEREDVIYSDEPEFSDFACMHKDKWLELYELLRRNKLENSIKNLPF